MVQLRHPAHQLDGTNELPLDVWIHQDQGGVALELQDNLRGRTRTDHLEAPDLLEKQPDELPILVLSLSQNDDLGVLLAAVVFHGRCHP